MIGSYTGLPLFVVEGLAGNKDIMFAFDESSGRSPFELQRLGVQVRPATDEENKWVSGMEDEMECGEPDLYHFFPEDEALIVLEIKDW